MNADQMITHFFLHSFKKHLFFREETISIVVALTIESSKTDIVG